MDRLTLLHPSAGGGMRDVSATVNLELDLRYADGSDEIAEVSLLCDADGPMSARSRLRVSDLPSDRERASEAVLNSVMLAIENWCARHCIRLTADPTAAVVAALGLSVRPARHEGSGAVATTRQHKNYERFLRWDRRQDAATVVQAVIAADGLERSEMGRTWGVTVFPSPRTAMRLNVGGREVLRVRKSGEVSLLLESDPGPACQLPASAVRTPGFDAVPGSIGITVALADALPLLEVPEVMRHHRSLVESSSRTLPKPNWHNPLVEVLL